MHILIVEDEPELANSTATFLAPHAVTIAKTLAEATQQVEQTTFDALILDLTLPDGNGLEWLEKWHDYLTAKVLVLTANDAEITMLKGLELADDYVVKPVSLKVLAARLNKLVPSKLVALGRFKLDLVAKEISLDDAVVPLSPTEWRLTAYFAQHQNELLTREQLLAVIWDAKGSYVNDNTLTVTIKRLREKLEQDFDHPTLIRTIRGMGYFIDAKTA